MATLSQFNNTNVPLLVGQTFTGAWERSLRNLELTCFINCSGYSLLTIEQSADGSNVRIPTSFNYTPTTDVSTFSVSIGLPFFRVKLLNADVGTQAYLSLNTYLIATPPQQVQVNGTVQASITGVVDVSGNVVSTPALNSAQLRTLPLVVGHWYQVASVGDTPGAVWAEMGAIVGSESVPPIGRQFQCLYAGYGTGTCYDITAPVNTSGTANVNVVSPLPAGTNIIGQVGFDSYNNIVRIDDGTLPLPVNIDPDHNTVKIDPAHNAISGTVSLTDPTTVRVRDSYGDPITTTAGNLMVGINNIYTANPLHTIVDSGSVSVSGSVAVTGTFYQATQPVSIASPVAVTGTFYQATQPVSIASSVAVTGAFYPATQPVTLPSALANNFLSASNTGETIKNSAGNLLSLFINSDGANGTNYVKIYNVATPTASDTPVMVLASIHGTFQNVDCWNVGFSTAIGLRVTAGSSNADNNPPTNIINVNAFYT